MADPEILYRGGEPESFKLLSGVLAVNTGAGYFDSAYSQCGMQLQNNIIGNDLRSSVSGGDDLWCSFFAYSTNPTGTWLTIIDADGRPALRVQMLSAGVYTFQHNTGSTASPSWVNLLVYTPGSASYFAIRLKTGSSKTFSLFINGDLIQEIPFVNGGIGAISGFTCGPLGVSSNNGLSQVHFSRNIPLVNSRLWTRKATAAGTYQQMDGVFSNIVKTALNDATGITSDTIGQITTNQYQDVTIPSGMVMHDEVWIWNRVKNSGSEPSSMKQACVINSVLVKGPNMPVDVGFQGLPHVLEGMTPALWNGCEVGQESSSL